MELDAHIAEYLYKKAYSPRYRIYHEFDPSTDICKHCKQSRIDVASGQKSCYEKAPGQR